MGRLNTRLWKERRQKRTKGERRRARCAEEQGARTNLGGGKKEGTKIISDGKHIILKTGTESRGNHSLCSGLEPHHPIMSKLWNLGGQNQRRKKEEERVPIRKIWDCFDCDSK